MSFTSSASPGLSSMSSTQNTGWDNMQGTPGPKPQSGIEDAETVYSKTRAPRRAILYPEGRLTEPYTERPGRNSGNSRLPPEPRWAQSVLESRRRGLQETYMFEFLLQRHMPDRTLIRHRAGLLDKNAPKRWRRTCCSARHANFSWRICCPRPRLAGLGNCTGRINPHGGANGLGPSRPHRLCDRWSSGGPAGETEIGRAHVST